MIHTVNLGQGTLKLLKELENIPFKTLDYVEKKIDACHMITSDIWGYKENITDNNVCIGSLKSN